MSSGFHKSFPATGGGGLPATSYGDTILDFQYPTGQAGTYNFSTSDALVAKSGVTFAGSSVTLDANGFATSTGYNTFIQSTNSSMPTIPTNGQGRVYQVWGKKDATKLNGQGIRVLTNYQDASNFYIHYIYYLSAPANVCVASGSLLSGSFVSRINGASNPFTGLGYTGGAGPWFFQIVDFGDGWHIGGQGSETGTDGANTGSNSAGTEIGSRLLKTDVNFQISLENVTSANDWEVRGFRIFDLKV